MLYFAAVLLTDYRACMSTDDQKWALELHGEAHVERPPATAEEVVELMREWLNVDEPLVEAVGNTIAEYHRVDSQELARRVVATVIQVLEDNLR